MENVKLEHENFDSLSGIYSSKVVSLSISFFLVVPGFEPITAPSAVNANVYHYDRSYRGSFMKNLFSVKSMKTETSTYNRCKAARVNDFA